MSGDRLIALLSGTWLLIGLLLCLSAPVAVLALALEGGSNGLQSWRAAVALAVVELLCGSTIAVAAVAFRRRRHWARIALELSSWLLLAALGALFVFMLLRFRRTAFARDAFSISMRLIIGLTWLVPPIASIVALRSERVRRELTAGTGPRRGFEVTMGDDQ